MNARRQPSLRPTDDEFDVPATPSEPPILLTVEEAAGLLGVGRTTAYQLIAIGDLEVVRIGRCTRVPRDAIDEFVTTLRTRSAS